MRDEPPAVNRLLSVSGGMADEFVSSEELGKAVARFLDALECGELEALSIARRVSDLPVLKTVAGDIGEEHVLVLGTGGSSLGGQTLLSLADRGSGRVRFVDNIDPGTWAAALESTDPAKSHVLAISKSGRTAETLAQTLLAIDWLRQGGAAPGRRLTVITGESANPLRSMGEEESARILDHPAEISGRYSVLTLVGLLPALLAGIDAMALRRGAALALEDAQGNGVHSMAAIGARHLVSAERQGISVQILMPYADRLATLTRWWTQLWGESLGKDGHGSTPVAASGTHDQHRQLQLWCGGEKRHMVTFLGVGRTTDTRPIATGDPELDYLDGQTLGALFAAARRATSASLVAAGVPVRQIEVPHLDEEVLGTFLAHFMIETILVAYMTGIDPFNQPAVDDGKRRAREDLRAGRNERDQAPQ